MEPMPDTLLSQSPQQLAAWLAELRAGPASISSLDRHSLADGAALRSNTAPPHSAERREWAAIAVDLYDQLATTSDPGERERYEQAAMMLRARLIADLGSDPAQPLQNPQRIRQWFSERLPHPQAEIAALSRDWRQQSRATILMLRQIKNRINVLALLPAA